MLWNYDSELYGLAATTSYKAISSVSVLDYPTPASTKTEASLPVVLETGLLSESDLPEVAQIIGACWRGKPVAANTGPTRFRARANGVYVAARSRGIRIGDSVSYEGKTHTALLSAIEQLKKQIDDESHAKVDALEICLSHSYRKVSMTREQSVLFSNIRRGIFGLEIRYENRKCWYPPTYVLATNRSNKRLLERFRKHLNISERDLFRKGVSRIFNAEQLLVRLDEPKPLAIFMERGNRFVPVTEVRRDSTQKLAELASEWMFKNVTPDGRMTYKYWPSRGVESNSNNMIRQWMATIALGRVAKSQNSDTLWAISERNIDYNLTQFYHEEDGLGLIEYKGKVKLGALALAALALVEHPNRTKWSEFEAALRRTIDTLWKPDGSFITFLKPPGRKNDNQNFYPGETLLMWSALYVRERDPALLARFMKTFRYYRDWHRKHRNPAFIPWHTQAYYTVWKVTKDKELLDFVFEMNDWLLSVQQWNEETRYRDTLGRFYAPHKPFGPPHSSSTGVYLEGLIDAFRMAREMNDEARASRYRLAIVRGLRSVMQLQFVDEVDMFYISEKNRDRVRGGIRTTVYHNEIRCDNVQHNLMAILKTLQFFGEDDYAHP